MRKPVSNRQFLDSEILVLHIDGSLVETTSDTAGLLRGQYQCKIRKGTGGNDNLFTITFQKPLFGGTPTVLSQPVTVDSMVRPTSVTATQIQVRTLLVSTQERGTTSTDDVFYLYIFGPTYNKEGNF